MRIKMPAFFSWVIRIGQSFFFETYWKRFWRTGWHLRFAQPDWRPLLKRDREEWERFKKSSPDSGVKVLIATSVGAFVTGTTLESLLSVALTLRGAKVQVLLCDRFLPACMNCALNETVRDARLFSVRGPRPFLCGTCFGPALKMYRGLGLKVNRYSDFVSHSELETAGRISSTVPFSAIPGYEFEGMAVGEHSLAGALRFFARGDLGEEPEGEAVLRRYFHAALLTTFAVRNLIEKEGFECVVFNHGIYVPQGLVGEVCRKLKVRVVNWNPAYRRHSFIFSHDNTYHHTMMEEPVEKWERLKWNKTLEKNLLDYLKSRWFGTRDWIWFCDEPETDPEKIQAQIGVDFSRPTIGLLTNVIWDAQLHYPTNVFSSQIEWVLETIDYFVRRSDLQLLIRIHPAEIKGTLPSRQPMLEEIKRRFPKLSGHIKIIPPESRISTYVAMNHCDSVLIYGTKTGVELSCMGIPVIVAGEAWIRNKGITIDPNSREEYFRMLDNLPLKRRLTDGEKERAYRYAFHFFFRRMIPVAAIGDLNKWHGYCLRLNGVRGLMPDRDKGLDVICDGVLEKRDFIYPAEEFLS